MEVLLSAVTPLRSRFAVHTAKQHPRSTGEARPFSPTSPVRFGAASQDEFRRARDQFRVYGDIANRRPTRQRTRLSDTAKTTSVPSHCARAAPSKGPNSTGQVPKMTAPHSTHAKTAPRARTDAGVCGVEYAFPDPERSACLNDRPAFSSTEVRRVSAPAMSMQAHQKEGPR
jgi:hypothetical protein